MPHSPRKRTTATLEPTPHKVLRYGHAYRSATSSSVGKTQGHAVIKNIKSSANTSSEFIDEPGQLGNGNHLDWKIEDQQSTQRSILLMINKDSPKELEDSDRQDRNPTANLVSLKFAASYSTSVSSQ